MSKTSEKSHKNVNLDGKKRQTCEKSHKLVKKSRKLMKKSDKK